MSGLQTRREEDILILTLDRPKAANALDEATHDGLVAGLATAIADPALRGVVLTAAGEKIFSAGADLKQYADLDPRVAGTRRRATLVRTCLAILDFPKPLVVAVQGKAIGAGFMLAALADEVVASETAEFRMPEIALDMPSPLGFAILAARAGLPTARRLVQSGAPVDAEGAFVLGLIDGIAEAEHLVDSALARVRALAAQPAAAYAANKAWINREPRRAVELSTAEAERLHAARHAETEGRDAD